MSDRNNKTRVQLTGQEIKAIRSLVRDRLRGEVSSGLTDETLGGLLIKTGRASRRVKVTH